MAGRKDQVARPGNGKGCSCTTLRKATRRISQLYDTALAPSGLKTTQRAILAQIGRSEPTTVGELAGALVMDLDHAVVTNTQPRVRINRQPLGERSQFWPEAVSTKSGDRMKLVHVVLLRVLSHDRISHGSTHPISESPATPTRVGFGSN
jgi:hypothetical protein